MNVSSVSTLRLDGLAQLYEHRLWLALLLLLLYVFVMLSDSLVVYVICSQRSLHRLLCWLVPACRVAGAMLLASHLPICYTQVTRLYCDTYTFVSLSCGAVATQISNAYGLISATITIFLPFGFVLFSYGRVLVISLQSSKAFSTKALKSCLPHVLVFVNYSFTVTCELLHRRLAIQGATVATSILVVVVPTVFNPVVYGLKVAEIYKHVKRLLRCPRTAKTQPAPI